MWHEKFINKHGETKYRYYEKYKDPLTDKIRRVSVVLNKNGRQSQNEAQRRLNERIEAKLNDRTPNTFKKLTFHAACDEWFTHYKNTSGSKATTIKTKTPLVNRVKNLFEDDVLISKINLSYAQNKFNQLGDLNFTDQVNRNLLGIFKAVFKYVKRMYNLEDISFVDEITLKKKAKTHEDIENKRNNYLELSEIQSIINYIRVKADTMHSGIHKRFYLFAAYITEFQALNGMRIGELLAIKEEDIDLEHKTLEINGTIHWFHDDNGGFGLKDTTKTEKSYRVIGLTTRSCDILRKAMLENKKDKNWNDEYISRGFVFTNHKGNPMYSARFNKILREAANAVGIKNKTVTSHILRHSHISMLCEQGTSLKAIMNRVGHSDHRTTLQIYSHVTEQMDKEMMNRLEHINIS